MNSVAERAPGAGATSSAAPELAGLRVLLVHEWIYTWAGAERCLEQLVALMPHADVLAGIVTPAMRARNPIAAAARESWVGRLPMARTRHRWFLPMHALAFASHDTSEYDVVVSVSHAFEKAIRAQKRGAVHLSYCLSPPRYLWDLKDAHAKMANPVQRVALAAGGNLLRAADRKFATGVDRFVSLSRHVAERVGRWYGRDSGVVYPPVQSKGDVQSGSSSEPFLLTLGRLVPYKRVDLAVAAAERLGVRLIVAGDGPERNRLEQLAGSRTEFLGEVSESDAASLLSQCAAFVFCAEEDFGIAPLEANAYGKPVVAFAKGGALETMVDGVTATFFAEQTVDAVERAVRSCLAGSWDAAAIRRNAERFAPEHFRDGMKRELLAALAEKAA